MKQIARLAVLAVLACGTQVVLAEETSVQSTRATNENAEAYVNVAQVAAPAARGEIAGESRAPRNTRSMLHDLGLLADDGFPSKGGPLDD